MPTITGDVPPHERLDSKVIIVPVAALVAPLMSGAGSWMAGQAGGREPVATVF